MKTVTLLIGLTFLVAAWVEPLALMGLFIYLYLIKPWEDQHGDKP